MHIVIYIDAITTCYYSITISLVINSYIFLFFQVSGVLTTP